jgi:hypothetical protein
MTATPDPPPFLVQLFRLVDATLEDSPDEAELQAAGAKCLCELLSLLRRVLADIGPSLTVRELLLYLLKAVPIRDSRRESWWDLERAVSNCRPLGLLAHTHNRGLIDCDCHWVADWVGQAEFRLSRRYRKFVEEAPATTKLPEEGPPRDGPAEGGLFRWKGVGYEFGPRQWLLLKALWEVYLQEEEWVRKHRSDADKALRKRPQFSMAEEEVRHRVYAQSSPASPNTLWQLQHRTQDKLDEYRLPFSIVRSAPLYLRLKKRRTLTRT